MNPISSLRPGCELMLFKLKSFKSELLKTLYS